MDNTKILDPLDAVNEIFKPPIFYNSETKILNKTIINDLELLKTINETPLVKKEGYKEDILEKEDKPIYNYVFKPTNFLGEKVLNSLSTYYTTDVEFLKETQKVVDSVTNANAKNTMSNFQMEEVVKEWKDNKSDTGFCDKYLYIGWDFAKLLNNNAQFLQLMSLYNISSPVLSLCLPIFVLIVPFFIIKARGLSLNVTEYTEILHKLVSQHAIVKIFTSFHEVDLGQKIYLIISAAFYLFSIYQNILVCIKFYSNMKKIHDYLFKMKDYVKCTIDSMENYLDKTNHLVKYDPFNNDLRIHKNVLSHLLSELTLVTPFTISIHKIFEIGHIMHLFYQLYDNKEYSDSLLYSFGFNGYMDLLGGLKTNIDGFKLNKTTFLQEKQDNSKKKKKTNKNIKKPIFKKMYYPKFIDNTDVITNDCKFNKNIIITGPNASGKTTVLKSAMINLILSQQIGYGCYESLEMYPYDKFHCYLNIPDTSGRDSLFQAEARRCKEIMECIKIQNTDDTTHFCILDEIYSGTNPDEAVISANIFMKNIVKHENVTCLLTTHYVKLCKKLAKNKRIINCQMNTKPNEKGTDFEYTYKIANGISTVKGGLKVLKDLQI
jgi:hypothetical protein